MARGGRRGITYENFTITLESDKRVWIDGCLAILIYEREKIALKLSRRNLIVNGSDLILRSYSRHELCISGRISSVYLEER